MNVERTPSTSPLPPELADLDFEPFTTPDSQAEMLVCETLVALAHREVAFRADLARAMRLAAEAEEEYLAAESEVDRRAWRRRALVAEHAAARAALELDRVLHDRATAIKYFATSR